MAGGCARTSRSGRDRSRLGHPAPLPTRQRRVKADVAGSRPSPVVLPTCRREFAAPQQPARLERVEGLRTRPIDEESGRSEKICRWSRARLAVPGDIPKALAPHTFARSAKVVGARRFELPTPCTPCIPGPPARILRSGWEKNGLVRESENRPQVTSGRRESQGVTLDRGALRRFVVVDALTWQSYQVNEKREGARCHDVDTRSRARRGPGSTTAARGRVAFDRFEVRLEDNNEPRGREAMRDLGLPSLGEVCCSQQTHRTSNRSNRVRHTFRKPS